MVEMTHCITQCLPWLDYVLCVDIDKYARTVVPTKSDSDIIFCLQLLSQILTCTLHLC